MNLSRLTPAFLCAACLAFPAVAADAPKPYDLRDSLSASQFHQAGLDKLSPEELATLDAVAAQYAGQPGTDARTFDLRDFMTVRQFHQAGVDKLSPDELAALNAAVAQTPAKPAAAPAAAAVVAVPAPAAATTRAPPPVSNAAFGQEMMAQVAADAPENLTSTLPGRFRGWNGNTVFTLANGQVWVQAGPGMFDTDLQDPTVIIKRLYFGYLLTVPGQTQTVFVRRVH